MQLSPTAAAAPDSAPSSENVAAYVTELEGLGNKNSTILARLEELTEMAKILDPKRDWMVMRHISAKVRARPTAYLAKPARHVTSQQLVELGFAEVARASSAKTKLRAAIQFRDGS